MVAQDFGASLLQPRVRHAYGHVMVELNLGTIINAPIERCFDLSRSIEVHLLGTEQTGEQAGGGVTSGLIGIGELVRGRATHWE